MLYTNETWHPVLVGITGPETTGPETADPDTTDQETADPDIGDPESADPDTADPETADPDSEPDTMAATDTHAIVDAFAEGDMSLSSERLILPVIDLDTGSGSESDVVGTSGTADDTVGTSDLQEVVSSGDGEGDTSSVGVTFVDNGNQGTSGDISEVVVVSFLVTDVGDVNGDDNDIIDHGNDGDDNANDDDIDGTSGSGSAGNHADDEDGYSASGYDVMGDEENSWSAAAAAAAVEATSDDSSGTPVSINDTYNSSKFKISSSPLLKEFVNTVHFA